MILDTLDKAARYSSSIPGLSEALAFVDKAASLAPGRHALSGENYALIQEYETLDVAELAWEAHRNYADVQIMLAGAESMGWAAGMVEAAPYDEAKDAILAPKATGASELAMTPGLFVLFVPGEAHRPRARFGEGMKVRKLVVKLRMK